jgi:hypothetical protein
LSFSFLPFLSLTSLSFPFPLSHKRDARRVAFALFTGARRQAGILCTKRRTTALGSRMAT